VTSPASKRFDFRRRGLLPVFLLVTAAACAGDRSTGPPEIHYGLEECRHCRMIVSEERFAAAVVEDGEAAPFDDLGCLVAHLRERGDGVPADSSGAGNDMVAWVHDYPTGGWLPAAGAHFVRDPEVITPMGSGLLAFADRARAEEVATGAEVWSWGELLEHGSGIGGG
jgi:copper chaperone NosL